MMEYYKEQFLEYAKAVEDEEELRLATTFELKVNLSRIQHYSAYMQGARMAILKMSEHVDDYDSKVYRDAAFKLITSDLRHVSMWMTESNPICFRNHKRDKKGKLVSVEAYFAEPVTIYRDVDRL